jgi:hypothetical protein
MVTSESLVCGINDITESLGFHRGETLYGLNLRLQRHIEAAIGESCPEELEELTDFQVSIGDALELFTEYERLSLTVTEALGLIPARLQAQAE